MTKKGFAVPAKKRDISSRGKPRGEIGRKCHARVAKFIPCKMGVQIPRGHRAKIPEEDSVWPASTANRNNHPAVMSTKRGGAY